MNSNTQNNTSAADTSIGFDYQFYYFFYLLLDLRHGEKIGLEVKDDIHIELANGQSILIQTKHSVQENSKGQIINLTERDKDLWKTISNWTKIINEQTSSENFLYATSFQLITNKNNISNPFLVKINELNKDEISVRDFKSYLKHIANTTEDATIKGYINLLHNLPSKILSLFLKKIKFDLNEDNLIERIKLRLLENIHVKERINDVYVSLNSSLRDKNYLTVKEGDKNEISFENFNANFSHCYKIALSTKLPIRDHEIFLPSNPENQNFIKQLLDIKAIQAIDYDEIIELTTHMLIVYNNLSYWETSGELGISERKKFDANAVRIWKNSFDSKYREIRLRNQNGETIDDMESDIQFAALGCLDEIRKAVLKIEDTELDISLSNGHFYLLNETNNIGWHFDWKSKYAK